VAGVVSGISFVVARGRGCFWGEGLMRGVCLCWG